MTTEKLPPTPSSSYEDASSSEEEETEAVAYSKKGPETVTHSSTDSLAMKPSSRKVSEAYSKKRSGERDEGKSKRVKRVGEDNDKKSAADDVEETKKNYFQRVWTEEDELVLLQGFLDFPNNDRNAVYELVKKSISFEVTQTQFMEKIRALKKKFEKKKEGEEEPTFSKPHDLKIFHLSKSVWGHNMIIPAKQVVPAVLKPDEPAAMKKQGEFVEAVARFYADDLVVRKGWSRVPLENKKILEEEWEARQLEELKLYSRKIRSIHRGMKEIVKAFQLDH